MQKTVSEMVSREQYAKYLRNVRESSDEFLSGINESLKSAAVATISLSGAIAFTTYKIANHIFDNLQLYPLDASDKDLIAFVTGAGIGIIVSKKIRVAARNFFVHAYNRVINMEIEEKVNDLYGDRTSISYEELQKKGI